MGLIYMNLVPVKKCQNLIQLSRINQIHYIIARGKFLDAPYLVCLRKDLQATCTARIFQ